MQKLKTDFLIIGQGIAGSMMAWQLMEAGQKVLVVDNGLSSASSVAAGLFNPVTGRRFVKSWLADELLPFAKTTYHKLEEALGGRFYYQKPIIHFISGQEEKKVYERSLTAENRNYIAGFHASTSDDHYASCEIKEGGFVDVSLFIKLFRAYLGDRGLFVEDTFDFKDLDIQEDIITWKDINASHIIFCEGYRAIHNPYFTNMPFNLAKGEILTLKIPGLNAENILVSGIYLAPMGNDFYKLGATYQWDDLESGPTVEGKEQLLTKLKNITDLPVLILDHEAGVRPTTKERRPFLGTHPVHKNVSILNGMGTKGVLLAPYFADQLCRSLLQNIPVDAEVDVRRWMHNVEQSHRP